MRDSVDFAPLVYEAFRLRIADSIEPDVGSIALEAALAVCIVVLMLAPAVSRHIFTISTPAERGTTST